MSEPDRRRWGWLSSALGRIAGRLPPGRFPETGTGDPANDSGAVPPVSQSWTGKHTTDLAVLRSGVLDNQQKFDRWMQYSQSKQRFAIVKMTLRVVLVSLVALGAGAVQQIRFGDPDGVTYAVGLVAVISMFGVLAVVLGLFHSRKS